MSGIVEQEIECLQSIFGPNVYYDSYNRSVSIVMVSPEFHSNSTLHLTLPPSYPESIPAARLEGSYFYQRPGISTRVTMEMDRAVFKDLVGCPMMLPAVQWLHDYLSCNDKLDIAPQPPVTTHPTDEDDKNVSMEIVVLAMHHIYSSEKKGVIEDCAHIMGITGLYLYGKPGRVIAEGESKDIAAYESEIRRLRWSRCCTMGRYPFVLPKGKPRYFVNFRNSNSFSDMCEIVESLELPQIRQMLTATFRESIN